MTHITTDIGRCRAWIRSTLNDCVFRSYLTSAVKYRRYIIKFYNKTAIIRDHGSFEKIIALLESIDRYHFDLTLNSSLLNTWPNSTLMLAGYWTPALKNNPLHNINPQVAEAVDVNDVEDIVTTDYYSKSEESYPSSLSSSFVDSEFFRKLPKAIIDEDARWNILMNQPSTSYTTSMPNKDIIPVEIKKEDISESKNVVIESNETVIEENESAVETVPVEDKSENIPIKNEKDEPQSFYELLESYNSREKNSFDNPKVEELYKQLVPRIIEEQYFHEPKVTIKSVSKIKSYKFSKQKIMNNDYYLYLFIG